MTHRLLSLLLFFLLWPLFGAFADPITEKPFVPFSPEVLGQGGSFAAVAEGYNSFFTNPAGFALTEGEATFPSFTTWIHAKPDSILPMLAVIDGDNEDETGSTEETVVDLLEEQLTTNGFGIGSALGFGYIGNRVALGLSYGIDSYFYGRSFPLGLTGESTTELTFIAGYGHDFQAGPVQIAAGANLRPLLRVHSLIKSDTTAGIITDFTGVDTGAEGGSVLENIDALNGWGVGVDAGIIASYRDFSLGIQGRDLFNTRLRYSLNSAEEVVDALGRGGLPASSRESISAGDYIIPMELSFGLAYQPDFGALSNIVDPEVHAQVTDPFKLTDQDREKARSFWTRLHLGTEITLLNFFDVRMGVNQGYVTLGAGMDLLFLEAHFSVFTRELGRYPGDRPTSGAALEMALRM
ncbi:MAG: hypothetical protein ACOC25_09485 [Alkalispirochaetaceae bacterium]